MYFDELDELTDVLETIIFEDEPSIFTEEYTLDLMETALHLMEEFMSNNPCIITEPDFNEILLEELTCIFAVQFEDHIHVDDNLEDDMNELLEEVFNIYITSFYPERSIEHFDIEIKTQSDNDSLAKKIDYLRSIPQPIQRTPEWYKFRHNLITASNAYKAFESQSTINQLIYEKCQPLKLSNEEDDKPKMTNLNTPLHWGQKYEPLSVILYEDLYNTKVEDFGCIPHSVHTFLGASPDGIVVDVNSDRYGRMLEIKNVVSREITGIPKKEYWIQMQLQMEVCDLDECDFLETKFTEYPDTNSFFSDGYEKSEKGETKGSIMYFNTQESKPFYLYKPQHITKYEDINQWEEEMVEVYQQKKMVWIKNIYWKLERMSCVLVLRNKDWFKNNVKQIEKVWSIIKQERITGFEHRAPNRKPKKDTFVVKRAETTNCLLNVIKINTVPFAST